MTVPPSPLLPYCVSHPIKNTNNCPADVTAQVPKEPYLQLAWRPGKAEQQRGSNSHELGSSQPSSAFSHTSVRWDRSDHIARDIQKAAIAIGHRGSGEASVIHENPDDNTVDGDDQDTKQFTGVDESTFYSVRSTLLDQGLVYNYDGASLTLTIYHPCPSPLTSMETGPHTSLGVWAEMTLLQMKLTRFILPSEALLIIPSCAKVKLATSLERNQRPAARKRFACSEKKPDASWKIHGSNHPSIVFKCGWSQNYTELVEDAEQYLLKSHGRTAKVIILSVNEDQVQKRILLAKRKVEFRQRQQGGACEQQDDPDHAESETASNASSTATENEERRLLAARLRQLYIAPITATLEVWSTAFTAEGRVRAAPYPHSWRVYPRPEPLDRNEPRLSIARGDLFRYDVTEAPCCAQNQSRLYHLDIDLLTNCLEKGLDEYAWDRMDEIEGVRERRRWKERMEDMDNTMADG